MGGIKVPGQLNMTKATERLMTTRMPLSLFPSDLVKLTQR